MRLRWAGVILSSCVLLMALSPAVAALERSVSTSRQFIVYGPEAGLRGGICDLAERTKKNALRILRQSDGWQTPILVQVRQPQANLPEATAPRLHFSQTGFGLKIQLDLIVGAEFSGSAVEQQLLRAVLLERMYRDQPDTPAGTPYVEPPQWLIDGLRALSHGQSSTAPDGGLADVVKATRALPLHSILQQQPALLDSPSRILYEAYAAALVSMLIESPGGAARLQKYIGTLRNGTNDPLAELSVHFPALGQTAAELEKSWAMALVRIAGRERYRMLGCEETERQLAQVLRVEIQKAGQAPVVYALNEFATFTAVADARVGLKRLTEDLLLLSGRANPLYRPVIAEYQQIATALARKKTKKIPERLAQLQETREQIGQRMTAIEDYMNWFEATQARATSGAFGEYMKAADVAARREPRRRDPISVYLDSMEAQLLY